MINVHVVYFSGPRPGPPRNVTIRQQKNGLLISWLPPINTTVPVSYYVVFYRTVGRWVPLTNNIEGGKNWYLWTTSSRGATYHFQVFAYTTTAHSTSSKVITYETGGMFKVLSTRSMLAITSPIWLSHAQSMSRSYQLGHCLVSFVQLKLNVEDDIQWNLWSLTTCHIRPL